MTDPPHHLLVVPPAAYPALIALVVIFGLYMAWEGWRWFAGNKAQLTPGQFRRRMFAGVLLEVDLILWLLADPLMLERPVRERLLYVMAATLFVLIPMLLAVREAAFVMRQYARWRGELARNLGDRDRSEP